MESTRYIHDIEYHNLKAAKEIVPFLIELLQPISVIDIGCGTGSWLRIFLENGIKDVAGIDGIIVSKDKIEIPSQYIQQFNLSYPLKLNRKYDLAICLEVAEHLPKRDADTIIKSLVSLSDIILFSAAIPGQGGQNHLNEQWLSYWEKKFQSHAYYPVDVIRPKFWDNSNVNWWYRQNSFLLVNKNKVALFGPPTPMHNLVHPELYLERLEQLKKVETGEIGFRRAFRTLLKAFRYSFLKKFSQLQNHD